MEADSGLAVPFFQNPQHTAIAGFFPYGGVMYEHGGGLDYCDRECRGERTICNSPLKCLAQSRRISARH